MAYINKINVDGVDYEVKDSTVPIPTVEDHGKFLMASSDGVYKLIGIERAEGVSF